MWWSIKFELEKIKKCLAIKVSIVLLILISILFTVWGLLNYRLFQEERARFNEYEKLNVSLYQNYEQYGAKGFKMLSEITPLDVFFDLEMSELITANVDTAEIVDINKSVKGEIWEKVKKVNGFSDIFLLGGSIFLLIIGLKVFNSKEGLKFYKNVKTQIIVVFSRMVIYMFLMGGCLAVGILLAIIYGIRYNEIETFNILRYAGYSCFMMAYFFLIGIVISLTAKKRTARGWIFFIWITHIIVFPIIVDLYAFSKSHLLPTNSEIALKKRRTLMGFEKKLMSLVEEKKGDKNVDMLKLFREEVKRYLLTGYIKNDLIEKEKIIRQRKINSEVEKVSMIFPTAYYSFLTKEYSTKGIVNKLNFQENVLNIKNGFVWHYYWNRYYPKSSSSKKIEPYIKNEYIIRPKVINTNNFNYAFGIQVLYTVILLSIIVLIMMFRKKNGLKSEETGKISKLKSGLYHRRFESEDSRDKEFEKFQKCQIDKSMLNRYFEEISDCTGIKIKKIAKYFSKANDVELKAIKEVLENFEITFESELGLEHKMQKKLYAALFIAESSKILIINDFVKNESKEFQNQFKKAISYKINQGGVVLYFSTEMYSSETRKNAFDGEGELKYIPNIMKISLR